YLVMGAVHALATGMIYSFVAIYYVQNVAMNPLQLVLVGTVLELAVVIFEIPTGILADVYSRRWSVILGYALIGVCFVLEGFIPIFGLILVAEVIRAIGETLISGALDAWLADEIGPNNLGQAYLRSTQIRYGTRFIGIILGTALALIALPIPIVTGGFLLIALSGSLIFVMTETKFEPVYKDVQPLRAMRLTFSNGRNAVSATPILGMFLLVALFSGSFSEGFDRLWEAHLLTNIQLPSLGRLEPVAWFGLIHMGNVLFGITLVEFVRRHLNLNSQRTMALTLIGVSSFIIIGAVTFGVTRNIGIALLAFWLVSVMRGILQPVFATWLNQSIDAKARATVLSMVSQSDALGQVVGGPAIGWLATVRSLRVAITVSAFLLVPALPLYLRELLTPTTSNKS
ncbi:MAG: MFS transporter, partial [Deinococcota bacterium]